ncbi:MAG: hypothetical protein A2201_02525 [Alicyclobacillus sp. RIFOXYA1_FULL_53_8]|nr:MAG: hypothetical protein A2201_02525 [Alicyclobacillus sp. RIFOXYA1_FULL_53_8]
MNLKPILQNKWLLVLAALGVLFILFGTFWSGSGKSLASLAQATQSNNSDITSAGVTGQGGGSSTDPAFALQSAYEKQLTTMLEQLQGIHQVSVMLTLYSTGGVQVANNQRTTTQTSNNGNQVVSSSSTQDTEVFTQRTQNGSQVPYVVKQFAPTVRGVFVTVSADDFFVAKAEIIDAIQHVLDVPAYKISVEPKKVNS